MPIIDEETFQSLKTQRKCSTFVRGKPKNIKSIGLSEIIATNPIRDLTDFYLSWETKNDTTCGTIYSMRKNDLGKNEPLKENGKPIGTCYSMLAQVADDLRTEVGLRCIKVSPEEYAKIYNEKPVAGNEEAQLELENKLLKLKLENKKLKEELNR